MDDSAPLYSNLDYSPEDEIQSYPFDWNDMYARMGACMLDGE